MKTFTITFFILPLSLFLHAQDLIEQLELDDSNNTEETTSIFKANRILLGQSTKTIKKGELNFAVMHNFGALNSGFKEFYGLDGANTALNFDYGINNSINIGLGRSTYQKNFQGYIKYIALKQSANMPLSIGIYSSIYAHSMDFPEGNPDYNNQHRLSYFSQFLFARKFNSIFSLQISPSYLHKNLVALSADKNDIFIIATGGRLKITNRTAFAFEYSYVIPGAIESAYHNYLGIGVNFETGGHVFQLRLSNTTSLYEPNYMTNSQSNWLDGDIHFGFTINRSFNLLK